jgi:hypothetical protein
MLKAKAHHSSGKKRKLKAKPPPFTGTDLRTQIYEHRKAAPEGTASVARSRVQ